MTPRDRVALVKLALGPSPLRPEPKAPAPLERAHPQGAAERIQVLSAHWLRSLARRRGEDP